MYNLGLGEPIHGPSHGAWEARYVANSPRGRRPRWVSPVYVLLLFWSDWGPWNLSGLARRSGVYSPTNRAFDHIGVVDFSALASLLFVPVFSFLPVFSPQSEVFRRSKVVPSKRRGADYLATLLLAQSLPPHLGGFKHAFGERKIFVNNGSALPIA